MNGVNVKNALSAVRLAKRIMNLVEQESGRRLVMELETRGKQARQAGDVGDALERGFKDGLNVGCRIAKIQVDELDTAELINAVYGSNDDSSC